MRDEPQGGLSRLEQTHPLHPPISPLSFLFLSPLALDLEQCLILMRPCR
jgi:hypothetical protein